jgi:hypothetical protein
MITHMTTTRFPAVLLLNLFIFHDLLLHIKLVYMLSVYSYTRSRYKLGTI